MTTPLPYDPGVLPHLPAPKPGTDLIIRVDGFPPIKDRSRSIRNRTHKLHERFIALRRVAIDVMAGRAWTHQPVSLELKLHAPALEEGLALLDYEAGIMDTLDGSHGTHFTFLPVVYNDDCQIALLKARFEKADRPHYEIKLTILAGRTHAA